jgi:hypothetical protein
MHAVVVWRSLQANSTSEVREFLRVVRGSCVHRVVSASPSRPALPACPMPVDVRTRGGSGAKCAIREGIIEGIKGARIGAVVPVPGGCCGSRAAQSVLHAHARCAVYDVAGRVTSSPGRGVAAASTVCVRCAVPVRAPSVRCRAIPYAYHSNM